MSTLCLVSILYVRFIGLVKVPDNICDLSLPIKLMSREGGLYDIYNTYNLGKMVKRDLTD